MALTMEDVDKILKKSKPKLLKRLDLDEQVMAELESVDVISPPLKSDLEGLPWVKKNTKFLDNLTRGPVDRFLNFCEVMHDNKKTNILEDMGVNIEDVLNQLAPAAPSAELTRTQPATPDHNGNGQAEPHQFPLWDSRHPGGEDLVIHDPMKGILVKKTPDLKTIVYLTNVWARLKGYDAIDQANVDRIQKGATDGEQVEKLMNFLTKGPIWCVHAFFKCLAETKQSHAITYMLGPEAATSYPAN